MVSENGKDEEYREQIIALNKHQQVTKHFHWDAVLTLEVEEEAHSKRLRNVVVVHVQL